MGGYGGGPRGSVVEEIKGLLCRGASKPLRRPSILSVVVPMRQKLHDLNLRKLD